VGKTPSVPAASVNPFFGRSGIGAIPAGGAWFQRQFCRTGGTNESAGKWDLMWNRAELYPSFDGGDWFPHAVLAAPSPPALTAPPRPHHPWPLLLPGLPLVKPRDPGRAHVGFKRKRPTWVFRSSNSAGNRRSLSTGHDLVKECRTRVNNAPFPGLHDRATVRDADHRP
jgi:hypothetical protein